MVHVGHVECAKAHTLLSKLTLSRLGYTDHQSSSFLSAIADLDGRAHTKHLLWKLAAAKCNMSCFGAGVQGAIAASWL